MKGLFFKKAFALILVIIYFSMHVVFASLPESNMWKERRQIVLSSQLSALNNNFPSAGAASLFHHDSVKTGRSPSFQSLSDAISRRDGNIRDLFDAGKNAPAVVLIEDVHMNTEAQNHIARILQELVSREQLKTVGVEGAFTNFDFKPFRAFAPSPELKETARLFLDKKHLSAPSYVGITSPSEPPTFQGIDDAEHYRANVDAYLSTRKVKGALEKEFHQRQAAINREKKKLFTESLYRFDALRSVYHSGQLGLGEYLLQLRDKEGIGLHDLSLMQFAEAFELEKTLRFEKADAERGSVLRRLMIKLTKSESSTLLEKSLALKAGGLTLADYYTYFRTLCDGKKLSLAGTPHLADYIRYVLLSEKLNANELFKAVAQLEERTEKNLAHSTAETDLLAASKHIELSLKLLDFSLTSTEWEQYKTQRSEIFYDGKFNALSAFEKFYEEAEIRSELMVSNFLNTLDVSQIASRPSATKLVSTTAALVVGGFHTAQITEILKAKKISYLVVSPKISKVDDHASGYLSVFEQAKTPLDKLFVGQKLFLGPDFVQIPDARVRIPLLADITFRIRKQNPVVIENWDVTVPHDDGNLSLYELRRHGYSNRLKKQLVLLMLFALPSVVSLWAQANPFFQDRNTKNMQNIVPRFIRVPEPNVPKIIRVPIDKKYLTSHITYRDPVLEEISAALETAVNRYYEEFLTLEQRKQSINPDALFSKNFNPFFDFLFNRYGDFIPGLRTLLMTHAQNDPRDIRWEAFKVLSSWFDQRGKYFRASQQTIEVWGQPREDVPTWELTDKVPMPVGLDSNLPPIQSKVKFVITDHVRIKPFASVKNPEITISASIDRVPVNGVRTIVVNWRSFERQAILLYKIYTSKDAKTDRQLLRDIEQTKNAGNDVVFNDALANYLHAQDFREMARHLSMPEFVKKAVLIMARSNVLHEFEHAVQQDNHLIPAGLPVDVYHPLEESMSEITAMADGDMVNSVLANIITWHLKDPLYMYAGGRITTTLRYLLVHQTGAVSDKRAQELERMSLNDQIKESLLMIAKLTTAQKRELAQVTKKILEAPENKTQVNLNLPPESLRSYLETYSWNSFRVARMWNKFGVWIIGITGIISAFVLFKWKAKKNTATKPKLPANSIAWYYTDSAAIALVGMAAEIAIIISSMIWAPPVLTYSLLSVIYAAHFVGWKHLAKQGRAPPLWLALVSHTSVFLSYGLIYHFNSSIHNLVFIPIALQFFGDLYFIFDAIRVEAKILMITPHRVELGIRGKSGNELIDWYVDTLVSLNPKSDIGRRMALSWTSKQIDWAVKRGFVSSTERNNNFFVPPSIKYRVLLPRYAPVLEKLLNEKSGLTVIPYSGNQAADILDHLSQIKPHKYPLKVLVCGGAGGGKSSLTSDLVTEAKRRGLSADLEGMDAYTYGRRFRAEMKLTGQAMYQTDSIDYLLKNLKFRTTFHRRKVNKLTGETEVSEETIDPTKIELFFFEGILTVANPQLRQFFDAAIYVDESDDVRFERRLTRDQEKKNYSPTYVAWTFALTQQSEFREIRDSSSHANIVVNLENKIVAEIHHRNRSAFSGPNAFIYLIWTLFDLPKKGIWGVTGFIGEAFLLVAVSKMTHSAWLLNSYLLVFSAMHVVVEQLIERKLWGDAKYHKWFQSFIAHYLFLAPYNFIEPGWQPDYILPVFIQLLYDLCYMTKIIFKPHASYRHKKESVEFNRLFSSIEQDNLFAAISSAAPVVASLGLKNFGIKHRLDEQQVEKLTYVLGSQMTPSNFRSKSSLTFGFFDDAAPDAVRVRVALTKATMDGRPTQIFVREKYLASYEEIRNKILRDNPAAKLRLTTFSANLRSQMGERVSREQLETNLGIHLDQTFFIYSGIRLESELENTMAFDLFLPPIILLQQNRQILQVLKAVLSAA